jgi:hypothetical protein
MARPKNPTRDDRLCKFERSSSRILTTTVAVRTIAAASVPLPFMPSVGRWLAPPRLTKRRHNSGRTNEALAESNGTRRLDDLALVGRGHAR